MITMGPLKAGRLAASLFVVAAAGLMSSGCPAADSTPEASAGEIRRFLTELPKAELHLHLEGSLSPRTVVDLATRNGIESFRTVEDVERSLASREPGLLGFLGHYNKALKVLRTRQDFYQAAAAALAAASTSSTNR